MTPKTIHYTITSKNTDVTLKVSYRGGKFFRLEKSKGKLTEDQLKAVGKIIPPLESDMQSFSIKFPDITYNAVKKEKSQFSAFNDAWFVFYEKFTGIPPKFGAMDAVHLKKIITHLNTIGGGENEALNLWNTILATWPKLDEFHRNNTDIKYINSRLNVLLNAVKKTISTNTSASGGVDNSVSL